MEIRRKLKTALFFLAVLAMMMACDLPGGGGGGGSRGGGGGGTGSTIDPWEQAVSDATNTLNQNPNFESHLREYEGIASEIDEYIGVVESTQGFINVANDIKRTDIPFVGNGWDLLIETLEVSSPGAGYALNEVYNGLVIILEFKHSINNLSNPQGAIDASSTFRSRPSKDTLLSMEASFSALSPALDPVYSDLKELNTEVESYLESIRFVLSGMNDLGDLMNIPVLSDLLTSLSRGINNLLSPVQSLYNLTSDLENNMRVDMSSMESIIRIVDQASR